MHLELGLTLHIVLFQAPFNDDLTTLRQSIMVRHI